MRTEYDRLRDIAEELIRAYAYAAEMGGSIDWETIDAIHDLAASALGEDEAERIRAEVARDAR